MMKLFRLSLGALILFGVSACAPQDMRLVETVDARQFVRLSRSMRPAMIQKQLVDEDGSWYSSRMSSLPTNAGLVLVERLSPEFLKSEDLDEDTFRASLKFGARVETEPFRARIQQDDRLVVLELVAVTDWNGDGQEDWIVRCRSGRSAEPQIYREYVMVLTELGASVIQPRLLLVQDSFYGKETVIEEPFYRELVDSHVNEYLQGQTDVTQAPKGRQGFEASQVKQSSLSW